MSRPLLVRRSDKDGRRVGPVVGVVGGVLVHQLQGERAPLRQTDGQPGVNVIKLFSECRYSTCRYAYKFFILGAIMHVVPPLGLQSMVGSWPCPKILNQESIFQYFL